MFCFQVKRIKVNPRTGIPENVLGQNKLTKSVLERHNENMGDNSRRNAPHSVLTKDSRLTALSFRDKQETSDEKRLRKKDLKEYRRERRMEKKQNKLAFGAEAKRYSEALKEHKMFNQGFKMGGNK